MLFASGHESEKNDDPCEQQGTANTSNLHQLASFDASRGLCERAEFMEFGSVFIGNSSADYGSTAILQIRP